jgi:uncharacterized protein (TIGR03067 family)
MVTKLAFIAAIWCSSVALAAQGADPNAEDLKRMQGDWMVATMKSAGMDVPPDEAQALFRTVEGDRYSVARYTKQIASGTFKLDATKTPKTIDSTPGAAGDGKTAPQPILGIYEFDGDKLRICNGRPGQPRPKNFDAKMYTGHTLIVWEREAK